MKNCFKFSLFILFLSVHCLLPAQENNNDRQIFYADILKKNGVIVASDITRMAYVDIQKIAKYNFDGLRSYSDRQQVKLKNGPVVELLSIQDKLAAGLTIDSAIIATKKEIAKVSYTHPVMPVVDVKIGYKESVKQGETTTIFLIPKDNN